MYIAGLAGELRQLNIAEQEGCVSYRHAQASSKRLFTSMVMHDSPKAFTQLPYTQVQSADHWSLEHSCQPVTPTQSITGTCATGHSLPVTVVPPNDICSQQPPTLTQSFPLVLYLSHYLTRV